MHPKLAIDGTFTVVKMSQRQERRARPQLQLIELTIQLCRGMKWMQMRPSEHSSTNRKSGDKNENPDVSAIRPNDSEDDVLGMAMPPIQ